MSRNFGDTRLNSPREEEERMKQKQFNGVVGAVFFIIALLHLLRVLFHWEAVVAGRAVSTWVSVVAVLVAGYLSYTAFKLKK